MAGSLRRRIRNFTSRREDLRLLDDGSFVSELAPICFPVTGAGVIEVAPGWLYCNGATTSRTGPYKRLFDEVGTSYNTGGEAGTDFRLPDYRGRSPLSWADGQAGADRVAGAVAGNAAAVGGVGGADVAAVAKANLPTHVHDRGTLNANGGSHTHGVGTVGVVLGNADGFVGARVALDGGSAPATTVNLPIYGDFDAQTHSHPNADFAGATEDGTVVGLGAGSPTHNNVPPHLPARGMVIRA